MRDALLQWNTNEMTNRFSLHREEEQNYPKTLWQWHIWQRIRKWTLPCGVRCLSISKLRVTTNMCTEHTIHRHVMTFFSWTLIGAYCSWWLFPISVLASVPVRDQNNCQNGFFIVSFGRLDCSDSAKQNTIPTSPAISHKPKNKLTQCWMFRRGSRMNPKNTKICFCWLPAVDLFNCNFY